MFTEILKFRPQIDRAALNSMLRNLSRRFASVARRFGQGLRGALRMAPIFAIAGAALTKLLNPLKKAEEVLDRVLAKGDDAATNAQQLGTDPGAFLRLQAVAQARGVSPEAFLQALIKFQSALAKEQEAAKDKTSEPGTLREFIGEKDTAKAFFSFVQSLQKEDKSRQVVVQTEIFGDRAIGKLAEFFNFTGFEKLLAELPSTENLSKAAIKLANLSDRRDELTSIRDTNDLVQKSTLVNESMLTTIDRAEKNTLANEDEDLKRFEDLKTISGEMQATLKHMNELGTDFLKNVAPLLSTGLKDLSEGIKVITPYLKSFGTGASETLNKMEEKAAGLYYKAETMFSDFKNSSFFKSGGRKR